MNKDERRLIKLGEPSPMLRVAEHFIETWIPADIPDRDIWGKLISLLFLALEQGHHCLDLSQLDIFIDSLDWEERPEFPRCFLESNLSAPDFVGDRDFYKPIILQSNRLYLQRYWIYESQVAKALANFSQSTEEGDGSESFRPLIDRFYPDADPHNRQREAVAKALTNRLSIISGGPGTGKTYTAARIIEIYLNQHEGRMPRIALAAPSGKSVVRLRDSLLTQFQCSRVDKEIMAEIAKHAFTVHRLLGARSGTAKMRYHRKNPLPYDFLVVDEISMLDIALVAKLLEAIHPQKTQVVFLGDADQLAPVEAGAVLSDIAAVAENELGFEHCQKLSFTRLDKSRRYRSESGIGMLVNAVRRGNCNTVEKVLATENNDLVWHSDVDWGEKGLDYWIDYWIQNGYAFVDKADNVEAAYEAVQSFKILTALRGSYWGMNTVNRLMKARILEQNPELSSQIYYRGMPIIITRNDYVQKLFNGDIGVIYPDKKGRNQAWFPAEGQRFRAISPTLLPSHELAYALTIHRSQGSEFDRIAVLLPPQDHPLLTRELFYTAVSRSRTQLELHCPAFLIPRMLNRRSIRFSGLRDQLRQAKNLH